MSIVFVLCGAWHRPGLPGSHTPTEPAARRLDYVVIKVNGEAHVVNAGDELAVTRGDLLEVTSATLAASADQSLPSAIGEVNVIGYKSPSPRSGEDRGYPFRTGQLKTRYAEDGGREVFAIVASTDDKLHGAVFLRLVDPVLQYAEVTINGSPRVVRDGESLVLKASDQFKVDRIRTNVMQAHDVGFHIVPADLPGHYVLRFERRGRAFANVPLRVVE